MAAGSEWLRLVRAVCAAGIVMIAISLGLNRVSHAGEKPDVPARAPLVVFQPAKSTLPMGANLLANPGFELGVDTASAWVPYGKGYGVTASGGRSGNRAVVMTNTTGSTHGAYQVVVLNQAAARPIYYSAWSEAAGVTSQPNSDYSLYLDVYYQDGTPLYGQTLNFDTGSHDWQFREGFIVPSKPIKSISVFCLLRNGHAGEAAFDDIVVREVNAPLVDFDGAHVAAVSDDGLTFPGPELTLETADGLSVRLASTGGAVTSVAPSGRADEDPGSAARSGFFVRDVARKSDYVHIGGTLAQAGKFVTQAGAVPSLGLAFGATYAAMADRIEVHASLSDTTGQDRALTLYFALPVNATGWIWGDDLRNERVISGSGEFNQLGRTYNLGATGRMSRYPWAVIGKSDRGIAYGLPLSSPRVARMTYNASTCQFYIAFDLGLSPLTAKFPRQASVDFIIYTTHRPSQQGLSLADSDGNAPAGIALDAGLDFRLAAQGYYDRFPGSFTRRIPPEREGVWVAFSNLSSVPRAEDFGIRVHELAGLEQVAFDDPSGIMSFRYLTEPWSNWMPINSRSTNPGNYEEVMSYLLDKYRNGTARERGIAEVTLSSGIMDADGKYAFQSYGPSQIPWCQGSAGCAVFTLNPSPGISDSLYPLNKAQYDWNANTRHTYAAVPGLDGEYIDSFLTHADSLDLSPEHFTAVDTPLAFRTSDSRVGIAEAFATTEFARWLTDDVHNNLGKLTMANGILLDMPWGADLFDFMGAEVDWLAGGNFTPDGDATMIYRRALSYQRPYGLLMNTDFANLTHELVERYFQTCMFYGIYPSMFSQNAATNTYWEQPGLYNRDRPLFKRYIPLIRELNQAGWQSLAHAATSDPQVHIERFGNGPWYFTLRNTAGTARNVTITLRASLLGRQGLPATATTLLGGRVLSVTPAGENVVLNVDLPAYSSEIIFASSDAQASKGPLSRE